ncbi:MAG TPA: hypothetical protein VEO56_08480 [Bacteroidota bacterium]|nr:hypothetical protein [Bacteroidota bacterium]
MAYISTLWRDKPLLNLVFMTLNDLLHERTATIIDEATGAMARAHLKNYEKAGSEHTHQRLKALYVLTARAVKERNLGPMIAHADQVARERFAAGFDLWEVQTAFNVLEEAIWSRILKELPPSEYAEALGLISTVLGTGKDTLARRYVSLASKTRASSLNLQSLFTGTEGV